MKKRKLYKLEISSDGEGVLAVSLVENPAIDKLFIYLSKDFQMIQLKEVNADKHILIGPVLIPELEILRIDDKGEEYYITFSKDTVVKVAQLFLSAQNNNNATLEHSVKLEDLSIVESWIVEDSLKDKSSFYDLTLPVGTWCVMMKVNNDDVWDNYVKLGKVKGFSLEGIFSSSLVEASAAVIAENIVELSDEDILDKLKQIIEANDEDEKTLELLREELQ